MIEGLGRAGLDFPKVLTGRWPPGLNALEDHKILFLNELMFSKRKVQNPTSLGRVLVLLKPRNENCLIVFVCIFASNRL